MIIKTINRDEFEEKLEEQQAEISEMYYSCQKQQQGYQFWIYLDLEDLELKESAMLTMSTIPNPANWYPNTNKIRLDIIKSDGLDHLDDEASEYYEKNPEYFLDDVFRDKIHKYMKELVENSIELLSTKELIFNFIKKAKIEVIERDENRIEARIVASDIWKYDWSEYEPEFSELLYETILNRLNVDPDNVTDFTWEGNQMNTIEIEITLDKIIKSRFRKRTFFLKKNAQDKSNETKEPSEKIRSLLKILRKDIKVHYLSNTEVLNKYKSGKKALLYNPHYRDNGRRAIYYLSEKDYKFFENVGQRWDYMAVILFEEQFDTEYNSLFEPWYYVDFERDLVEKFDPSISISGKVIDLKSRKKTKVIIDMS